jgi:DNA-binding transcriptional LysR family regulator
MTLDQVIVFHTIIKTGSFKSAAAELNKTQPAISFSVKKMEEELSVELFDRSGYRPILTKEGKSLWEKSQTLIQGMHEVENLAQSFRNKEEPEISITVDGISPLPTLLSLFKKFGDRFPNTKLNLSLDILSEVERKVLARESLFGITHFYSEIDLLETIPITSIEMLPVVSSEIYETKIKSQDDLRTIDQIVVSDQNKSSKANFGLLSGGRKWFLSESNFKREIILAGLGWGHLPAHTVSEEVKQGKLHVLNFEAVKPRKLDINLIRLRKQTLGPVAKSLWEELTSWHG